MTHFERRLQQALKEESLRARLGAAGWRRYVRTRTIKLRRKAKLAGIKRLQERIANGEDEDGLLRIELDTLTRKTYSPKGWKIKCTMERNREMARKLRVAEAAKASPEFLDAYERLTGKMLRRK